MDCPIDELDELRLLLEAKIANMNALDREVFDMSLSLIQREVEAGDAPKRRYVIFAWSIQVLIAWFLWHPLAAAVVIFVFGNMRRFAIRNALFWSPATALVIGGIYGVALAAIVRIGAVLTTHTTAVGVALGILGFLAAGYVGYGVPRERYLHSPADEKRALAQVAAVGCYLIATAILFLVPIPGIGK